ncbi:MAG: YaeQ family protein [Betaproteobacteria bacterium]|nr:YaeQ family protein [Betaproteobacteria bacterium]
MALKATIFKAEIVVSDLDRGHFATHALTIARHPSETDERMMVRVLAFAMNADERLEFGRGLSSEGEADLVLTDLTGAIDLWIDVGLPDEREIRKACGRASGSRCSSTELVRRSG